MYSKPKNVVIMNHVNSEYIEQAIFILKEPIEGREASSSSIVKEARRIIANYEKRLYGEREPQKKKKRKRIYANRFYIALAIVSAIAFSAVLLFKF